MCDPTGMMMLPTKRTALLRRPASAPAPAPAPASEEISGGGEKEVVHHDCRERFHVKLQRTTLPLHRTPACWTHPPTRCRRRRRCRRTLKLKSAGSDLSHQDWLIQRRGQHQHHNDVTVASTSASVCPARWPMICRAAGTTTTTTTTGGPVPPRRRLLVSPLPMLLIIRSVMVSVLFNHFWQPMRWQHHGKRSSRTRARTGSSVLLLLFCEASRLTPIIAHKDKDKNNDENENDNNSDLINKGLTSHHSPTSSTSTVSNGSTNMLSELWETLQQQMSQQWRLHSQQQEQQQQQQQQHQKHTPSIQQRPLQSSASSSPTASSTSATHAASRGERNVKGRRRALFEHRLEQHFHHDGLAQNRDKQDHELHSSSSWRELLHQTYAIHDATSWAATSSHSPFHTLDRTSSLHASLPPMPRSMIQANRRLIQHMFQQAYDAYMYHAWPAAELMPITCQPGTFDLIKLPALQLIDALDTLLLMQNATEFARSVERLRKLDQMAPIFAVDQNVSIFETNIRLLGGLLSAHQMAVAFIYRGTNSTMPTEEEEQQQQHQQQPKTSNGGPQFRVQQSDVFDVDGNVRWGYQPDDKSFLNRDDETCQASSPPRKQRVTSNSAAATVEMISSMLPSAAAAAAIVASPMLLCDSSSLSLQDCDASASTVGDPHHHDDTDDSARLAECRNMKMEKEENEQVDKNSVASSHTSHSSSKVKKNATAVALDGNSKIAAFNEDDDLWQYDGFLLDLAKDLGLRLLPAFDTRTGIPYGTINLLYGVPSGETTVASLAGGGTLSLEFETLSRLTGHNAFGRAAKLASRALWLRRSQLQLVGKHIDIQDGRWTESLSGIGSNSDSFYEYLLKHYVLFPEDDDFWMLLTSTYSGIDQECRQGEFYADVDMNQGSGSKSGSGSSYRPSSRRVLESLMAFYPGLQVLLGELVPAARSLNAFFMVRELLGFLPERFHYGQWKVDNVGYGASGAARHPLRPELLESCYFLHRATKDLHGSSAQSDTDFSGWLWAADFALHKLHTAAKTTCGYASVREVKTSTTGSVNGSIDGVRHSNEMPSFFLSETLKYLYLTFDNDNILHTDIDREWIFTTEAHPLHYERPAKTSKAKEQSDSLFEKEVDQLIHMVQDRLHRKRSRKKQHMQLQQQRNSRLEQDKWTDSISVRSYTSGLHSGKIEMNRMRAANGASAHYMRTSKGSSSLFHGQDLLEPFIPLDAPTILLLDAFGLSNRRDNLAYTSLRSRGVGSGYALRKACRNFYAPDLLWLHALHGGATDYSEVYVAMTMDDADIGNSNQDPPSYSYTVVGAADAMGWIGTGTYLSQTVDSADKPCSFDLESWSSQTGVDETPTLEVTTARDPSVAESEDWNESNGMTEIRSDIGSFEVSSFPDGGGFYVHHVDSGERVVATFLTDGSTVEKAFAMIHVAAPPRNQNRLDTGSFRRLSMFGGHRDTDTSGAGQSAGMDRRVILADFEGNSFSCEVVLLRKELIESVSGKDTTSTDEGRFHEDLLLRIPCAPALFGQSHLSRLIEDGDVVVEAPILGLLDEDLFGCVEEGVAGDEPAPVGPVEHNNDLDLVPSLDVLESSDASTMVDDKESDSSPSACPNNAIHVVHRGECTFFKKASNRKARWDARAVIVVNTESDELFFMSHGDGEDHENVTESSSPVPPTVLVSGPDGEELIALVNTENASTTDDTSFVVARVSLARQKHGFDANGHLINANSEESNSNVHFPVVHGSSGTIQILLSGGWGVHASQAVMGSQEEEDRGNDDGSSVYVWQLHLLKHGGAVRQSSLQ